MRLGIVVMAMLGLTSADQIFLQDDKPRFNAQSTEAHLNLAEGSLNDVAEISGRRKSRRKQKEISYYPKTRLGPNKDGLLPVAVMTPARKGCDHHEVKPFVDFLRES